MKDILIVDNSCLSFAFNINNGVPILPFYDSAKDEELRHLNYYLNCLHEANVYDVRDHNQEAFGLLKLRDAHQTSKSSIQSLKNNSLIEANVSQTSPYLRNSSGQPSKNAEHQQSKEYL